MLREVAVRHIAKHHEIGFLARKGDDAFVNAGRGPDESILRVGHREAVHNEPILVVTRFERRRGVRPDALLVFGHVKTAGAVREVADLGHIGNDANAFGVGSLQAKRDRAIGRIDVWPGSGHDDTIARTFLGIKTELNRQSDFERHLFRGG